MARKLLTITSAASLLISALLLALWARNFWVSDVVAWSDRNIYSINAENGVFRILYQGGIGPIGWTGHTTYPAPGRGRGLWAELRSMGHALAPLGIDFRTNFPNKPPNAEPMYALYLPHWLLILLTGGPAALWLRRERRVARIGRRTRLGQCVSCGYDLRATSQRCPECGATVDADKDFAVNA